MLHPTDDHLADRYRSGLGIRKIAQETGLSTWKVRQALLREQVEFRGARGKKIDVEAILEDYRETQSCAETAGKFNLHRDTVEKYAREAGILRAPGGIRKYAFNEEFFAAYTREACYWAGFLAADGSLVDNGKGARIIAVMLARKDREHLSSFTRCAGSEHPVHDLVAAGVPESQVRISSRRWWDDLHIRFNLTQRKSFTLQPPPQMPDEMNWHYVRGYFDGDGTAAGAPKQIQVWSGSRLFIEWIKKVWGSHHKIGPHARIWRLAISGPVLRRVLPLMYADSTPDTRLARKYERLKEWL